MFLQELLSHPLINVSLILTKQKKSKRYGICDFLTNNKYLLDICIYPNSMREVNEDMFDKLDAAVVVSYGHKIPKRLLDRCCWLNMHASLLPKLRGPTPINYAIMNGFDKTGITLMLMNEGIDEGPIIAQREIAILKSDNSQTLENRVKREGSKWFAQSVHNYLNGEYELIEQNHKEATFTTFITDRMRHIDWNSDAENINNLIRSLSPDPGCICKVEGKEIKVIESEVVHAAAPPGTLLSPGLTIACKKNAIRLTRIIPPSSKAMSDLSYINGYMRKIGCLK